ncbi:ABC-2 family transporter protein [Streptomyces prunicolor]|uniref:ABC-2 family transporter protein n=1 Tax=Streptomyces prunicolor TaxID=67348 RepID=UPI00386F4550
MPQSRRLSWLLTFGLPLAFVAYFPAGVITGHGSTLCGPVWLAELSPLIGLGLYLLSRLLWSWSLKHYMGVTG